MNITDGNGEGNRKGIGIEIARSRSDLETFRKAEENGAMLCAWILKRYGWGTDRLKQHYDFSKKNCLPIDETELLTPKGWVSLADMEIGDTVAQYTKDGKIEFVEVEDVVEPYEAEVIKVHNVEATADHRMFAKQNQYKRECKFEIKPFIDCISNTTSYEIPVAGQYEGKGMDISDIDLLLSIWVQGDGHYMKRHSRKNLGEKYYIGIEFHFSKERKAERLKELLDDGGYKYTFNIRPNGNYRIRLFGKKYVEFFEQYLSEKSFTFKYLEMNRHQYELFFNEIQLVDGCQSNQSYSSSIEKNLDIVQAIMAINNQRSNIVQCGLSRQVLTSDMIYCINGIQEKTTRKTVVSCVTVPSGMILIRQYGQPKVVGNCPHRTRELGWNRFVGMVEKYLRENNPENNQVPVKGIVTVGSLNVRPTFDTSQNAIGKLKLNNTINITGIASNGWYEIDYDSKKGYVSNLYISITEYGDKFFESNPIVSKPINPKNQTVQNKSRQYTLNGLNIIETTPDNIEIVQVYGKPLRQTNYSGINGTFFDTNAPASTRSTWGLAVNNRKPIGENAHTNHHDGTKRATFSWNGGTQVFNQYINNINEFSTMPIWAIGGVNLISRGNPYAYDLKYEKVPTDVSRVTYHTGIAFKQGKIYLITTVDPMGLSTFKNRIQSVLDPDSAINLDGGGSTQMKYGAKNIGASTRRLNHAIVLKSL